MHYPLPVGDTNSMHKGQVLVSLSHPLSAHNCEWTVLLYLKERLELGPPLPSHITSSLDLLNVMYSTNTIHWQILSSHSPGPQGLSSSFQGSTIVYDEIYPKYKKMIFQDRLLTGVVRSVSYYPAARGLNPLFPLVWVTFRPLVWAFFPAACVGELLWCVCRLSLWSQLLGWGKKEKQKMIFHRHSSTQTLQTHI